MAGQEIASFYASIGADASGLTKGLNQSKEALGGLSRHFSVFEEIATGGLRRVGEAAVNLLGGAIGAVADLGKSVVQTGIDFNALQEQSQIAFTTMLGSGEKAQSFLDDLQKFAAKTPFEFPDLVQSSQRLLAMGISADKILPTMTAVGDAVAGLGGNAETINRVTTALGQMNAKGKASSEEMMQLTEAGIPAWEFLAKKIGKSIPDAMKEVTKGAVSAQVAIDAVTEGMEQKFGGMMEKQSHTWSGLISNLQDSFGQMSGKVMKPLFAVLEKGLSFIVDFTSSDAFTRGIDEFVTNFTNGLDYVIGAVKRFVSMFSVDISVLTSGNSSWGEKMLAVWDMLYTTGMGIWQSLLDGIVKLVPQWLKNLGGWGEALWKWIQENTPIALAKLGEWAHGLWDWIVANFPIWMENLATWGKGLWQWIVDNTPGAIAQLTIWGTKLWDWITTNASTWWGALKEWGSALWQWIVTATPIVIKALGDWWTILSGWVTTNAPLWWAALKSWGEGLWQWIVGVTPRVTKALGDWWTMLTGWIATNAPKWWATLKEWGKGLWQWIVTATPIVLGKLAEWGGKINEWLVSKVPFLATVEEWGVALWQWISDAFGPTVTWLGDLAAEYIKWSDVVTAAVIALGVVFWPVISGAFAAVMGAIGGFVAAWAPVIAIFAGLVVAVALVRNAWERDWGGIRTNTLDAIKFLGDAFGPLLTTIQEFGGEALKEIILWATGNETSFDAVSKIWESAKTAFGTVFEAIGAKLVEWGTLAWNWFKERFPNAAQAMMDAVDSIKKNFGQLWDALKPLIEKIQTWWGNLVEDWQSGTGNVNTAMDRMMKILDSIWAIMVKSAEFAINTMIDTMTLIVQLLNGDWAGAWETAKEMGKRAWDYLVDVVSIAVDGILALFGLNIQDVENWRNDVGDNLDQLDHDFNRWVGTSLSRFNDWRLGIGKNMDGLDKRFNDFIGDSLSEFGSWAGTLISNFAGWGGDIIQGIWNGITAKWTEFINWWTGVWNNFKNDFKSVFAIHSPSGVFEDYGKNMMLGLAQGIDKAKGVAFDTLNGMSAGLNANMTTAANYVLPSQNTGQSAEAALLQRNNELLVMLIQALQNKNMSANVTVNGGGMGLGGLVSATNGLKN